MDLNFGVGAIDEHIPVVLYKCDLSEEETAALNTFGNNFLNTTNVCDATGGQFFITEDDWEDLAEEFDQLSAGAQGMVVNVDYTPGAVSPNTIEYAISRYDYIYCKYHNDAKYPYITDFIGRDSAGTMKNLYPSSSVMPLINISNNNIVVVITVVTITSLVALLGFTLYKKKKQ